MPTGRNEPKPPWTRLSSVTHCSGVSALAPPHSSSIAKKHKRMADVTVTLRFAKTHPQRCRPCQRPAALSLGTGEMSWLPDAQPTLCSGQPFQQRSGFHDTHQIPRRNEILRGEKAFEIARPAAGVESRRPLSGD